MSTLPLPSRGADEKLGPADDGVYTGTAISSTTSAALSSLNATWGSVSNRVAGGGAFFSFQARGGDVYIRLVPDSASSAGTTSGNGSNGVKIPDGQTLELWVTSSRPKVDHIASASCTLFAWQSSPNYGDR